MRPSPLCGSWGVLTFQPSYCFYGRLKCNSNDADRVDLAAQPWHHVGQRNGGRLLSEKALEQWLWRGRAVKLVDGSGISMPDTPQNQA